MGKTKAKTPKKQANNNNNNTPLKNSKFKKSKKSPLSRLKPSHTKHTDEFKSKAKIRLQLWKEPGLLASVCYLLGDVSASVAAVAGIDTLSDLFRDLDLAIFGAPADEYKLYTEQLLAEYGHLDASHFKCMRLKLLQTFLTIPCIYTTDACRERFEVTARSNIGAEIEELKMN